MVIDPKFTEWKTDKKREMYVELFYSIDCTTSFGLNKSVSERYNIFK
jgi:hypothetical protein